MAFPEGAVARSDAEGHRERLRERFRRAGAEAFADHELLELLLTYAVPRRDVKEAARALRALIDQRSRAEELPGESSPDESGATPSPDRSR